MKVLTVISVLLALSAGAPVAAQEVPRLDMPAEPGTEAGLRRWIAGFRDDAIRLGISPEVYDAALAEIEYDTLIIERDRNQNEFSKAIWDYLDTAVSDLRIQNGRAALEGQREALERIEAEYGVDKEVLVAIWGLESAYGSFRGSDRTLQSLATLAYDGRRARFFESQLVAGLRIIERGEATEARLRGSWAGAMGHTQFMPGTYLSDAVDFDGDGARDIWGDDPVDALASAAAYLARNGWVEGQPWGVEVRLGPGFDFADTGRARRRTPSHWARLGVTGLDGAPVDVDGLAQVLLPAGRNGPAFMIFDNFAVLETYNTADAYVIAVGHLADRIAGGGPFEAGWPREDRVLTFDERLELQVRLTAAGFSTRGVDGLIGPLTIAAVAEYQASVGLVPDGYAPPALLERLRAMEP